MSAPYRRGRYYVYILSNADRSRVEVNAAYDLPDRLRRLREYYPPGANFPTVPRILVFWEMHASAIRAIEMRKELRRRNRDSLRSFVSSRNPGWEDLFEAVEMLDSLDSAALDPLEVEDLGDRER